MSSWAGVLRVAAAALVTLGALSATPAGAAPPPPIDLTVNGGEDVWHPENQFRLDWTNPVVEPPVAAVHYRVRDASGTVLVPDTSIAGQPTLVDELTVPAPPGIYDAEVWLEDAAGNQGAAAAAKLRFDNVRPGQAIPLEVNGWIDRAAFPYTVHIERPGGQPPLSGIGGYAVSIDTQPDSDPCAATARCTEAETNLHGGIGDDSFSIAGLPDGVSYVHAVAVSGSGMKSVAPGHAKLLVDTVDPATTLTGSPHGWSNQPLTLIATSTDGGSGMSPASGANPFTAIRVDGDLPRIGAGAAVSATVIGEGVHSVEYYARDAAGNVNDGQTSNGRSNAPPSRATVRIDRRPPEVSFANASPPGHPELIQVRVRDPLSGADLSRGSVGVRRAGSGDRFEALPGGPYPGGIEAHWDSDAYPPGEYEFQASGYDRAGNAAATRRRANGTAMVLSSPLKIPTTLSASLGSPRPAGPRCLRRGAFRHCRRRPVGKRAGRRLVAFGRGARLRGRLIAGIAAPLEGMAVRVVERFPPGAGGFVRVSTVQTGVGGRFAIRLPAGPSRRVSATFAGTPTLSRTASQPVQLGVRSSVRLHASSTLARVGGPPVVFRGGLGANGAMSSPAGKSVQLQFRLPGLPWSEFRTVQTNRRGRFRYAYRFSDNDSRGVRFQFRAYVPAQRDWPYEPAGSRPVAVLGR